MRSRVVWRWKNDLDEEALGRFVERLPDGRYVPGGVIPYLPILGVIPTVIVTLALPSLMTHAVVAGAILALVLVVCVSLLTKGNSLRLSACSIDPGAKTCTRWLS